MINSQSEVLLRRHCGERMFGNTLPGSTEIAISKVENGLTSAVDSRWYNTISPGKVITSEPSFDFYVDYVYKDIQASLSFFDRCGSQHIIDEWAKVMNKPKCSLLPSPCDFMPPTQKRFTAVDKTREEYTQEVMDSIEGIIVEPYITWYLNTNCKCPVCDNSGCIALAGASSCRHSVSFQDGVCIKCKENGVDTLFEYKIRREKTRKEFTHAGSYISADTFLRKGTNLFMVMLIRETGHIRLSKITRAIVRINEKFLYSIQEGISWYNPPSTVRLVDTVEYTENTKPMSEFMPKVFVNSVVKKAAAKLAITLLETRMCYRKKDKEVDVQQP